MSTNPFLLYNTLLFVLVYLNRLRLHKLLSYQSYSMCFFTLLKLKFIFIYVHFDLFMYYYYHALGTLRISFYQALYHCHSILTLQLSLMLVYSQTPHYS